MLRSILMIIIQELALIYGIVTHVSELSQNLVHMNKNLSCIQSHFWKTDYFQKWRTTLNIQIEPIYNY